MFHPKGPSVLNCHACILCGTKGAYVKNEQWIRLSARETDTERESKWLCKHRWLSLASLLVLHKCFEDVLFFPRPPNFSFTATVLQFSNVCLSVLDVLSPALTTTLPKEHLNNMLYSHSSHREYRWGTLTGTFNRMSLLKPSIITMTCMIRDTSLCQHKTCNISSSFSGG